MRHVLSAVLLLMLPTTALVSQSAVREESSESCTSIIVGRRASTDGSVITSHSCDGNYRAWLNIQPRTKNQPGSDREIWWGKMHTETPDDLRGMVKKGRIPQVPETYAYINTSYPFMNERQLAMGETTFGGREELINKNGLFTIEELQAVALERCATARDAIKLMGGLAEQYGYGDSGECLTVADKKEAWHFEIMGGGENKIGAVWAAVRIPDDHVGVSANIPRISEVDPSKPDRYMASANIFTLGREMGWWDPARENFKFWKIYGGVRKPYAIREFFILSSLAPSLNLNMDMLELPISVKPDQRVSPEKVFAFFRQTYEDTEYDRFKRLMVPRQRRPGEPPPPAGEPPELIRSPAVNPWMNNDMIRLINTIKPDTIQNQRTIAVPQCSYSHVTQLRDWLPNEVGGVAWFSFDNPGQSPRIPLFAGILSLPKPFEIDPQKKFRMDSAAWTFRRANKLAQVRWGQTKDLINDSIMEFEIKGLIELPVVEQRVREMLSRDNSLEGRKRVQEYLTQYSGDFSRSAMQKWIELGDTFWAMFARGF
ncbi:MAG: C69 family dipeptidase [Holophagales bacterium]|jgi:dipeptidase|nr:C69 family dipeptidase [Holophagales bacterium]